MSERVEFRRLDMFGALGNAQEIRPCPEVIDETAALLGRQIVETAVREDIRKQNILEALQCHGNPYHVCEECPYQDYNGCTAKLARDTLALIKRMEISLDFRGGLLSIYESTSGAQLETIGKLMQALKKEKGGNPIDG